MKIIAALWRRLRFSFVKANDWAAVCNTCGSFTPKCLAIRCPECGHFDLRYRIMALDVVDPVMAFAVEIGKAISKQTEIDNLGDCESVMFMEICPVLNLVQLAEELIKARS